MEKIFINVPYNIKDDAKALGALWDNDTKKWFVNDDTNLDLFTLIEIHIPYHNKDEAKKLGCIFNKDQKIWQTCKFNHNNIKHLL
jgi:general stress protein 26